MSRARTGLVLGVTLPMALAAAYLYGWFTDCEYVHWPTSWQASRAETQSGIRVAELIRIRAGAGESRPHWHHCGFCETLYAHASHFPVKVTISATEAYLFDWDASARRLLPITVRTAEVFRELIPSGSVIEPLSGGLDGQLHADRPCRIVAAKVEM